MTTGLLRPSWTWSRDTAAPAGSWRAWLEAAEGPRASAQGPEAALAYLLSCVDPALRDAIGNVSSLLPAWEAPSGPLPLTYAWGRSEPLLALVDAQGSSDPLAKAFEAFRAHAFWDVLDLAGPECFSPQPETRARANLLDGLVLLGSHENADPDLLDPVAAERAFVDAAAALEPALATIAHMGAAMAAYVQSEIRAEKLPTALAHAERAAARSPSWLEASFLVAKLRMASGATAAGLDALATGCRADLLFLVKACADADFQRRAPQLQAFVRFLRDARCGERAEAVTMACAALRERMPESPALAADPAANEILAMEQSLPASIAEATFHPLATVSRRLEHLRVVRRRHVEVEWDEGVLGDAGRGAIADHARVGDLRRMVRRRAGLREIVEVTNAVGGPWTGARVRVPAGSFRMGASPDDAPSLPESSPRHEVVITRPLEVWSTPIAQAHYERLIGENPAYFRSPARPVETVSWWDALRFCNALSVEDGVEPAYEIGSDGSVRWRGLDHPGWRLPTEAEWEFLCRAGTVTTQYGPADAVAWHSGNARGGTQDVGQLGPNDLGLYDTLGNVYEWCWDFYDDKFYRKSPILDPVNELPSDRRVIRGGSWYSVGWRSRASYRTGSAPATRNAYTGFRCVRTRVEG